MQGQLVKQLKQGWRAGFDVALDPATRFALVAGFQRVDLRSSPRLYHACGANDRSMALQNATKPLLTLCSVEDCGDLD